MDDLEREHRQEVAHAVELQNQAMDKKVEWIRRLLFLSATLFGILVSLYSNSEAGRYTHLCFAFSMVALAIGILLLAMALHSHIKALADVAQKYNEEVQGAIREGRKPGPVSAAIGKIFLLCEATAYILLIGSMLLLAAYAVLSLF